jgi:hypothetical protein
MALIAHASTASKCPVFVVTVATAIIVCVMIGFVAVV